MKRDEELLSKKRAIELRDSGYINRFEVGTTKGSNGNTRISLQRYI